MRSVRGVFLVLLFCMFIGALASQSSAQTTFTFTQTSTGGTLQPPESGNFGNVTLAVVTSGGPAACTTLDACIEVQLDLTANMNWNLLNQPGNEPTVGVFAFNGPTALSVLDCSTGTCSLNTGVSNGGVAYDGLGTYDYTLSDISTGSAVTGGNTITGNALTFYLQGSTSDNLNSISDIESPPTGTTSPNPVSDFGLNVCEANGSPIQTTSCAANTHAYAAITPEPASYLLFGTGLLGFGAILRKKRGSSVSV